MSLTFTLLPTYLVQFHGLLTCLSKFNESVSIEATKDGLRLSALNSTNSAHVSARINRSPFFSQYAYTAPNGVQASQAGVKNGIACRLYIKALLSVFKSRVNDIKDKDNGIERCVVELHDDIGGKSRCRLTIRMYCKHEIVRTYKLTYEAVDVQHAIFDSNKVENRWWLDSQVLREIMDHFGTNAEQLDIYCKNELAVFTSFTTKVTDGQGEKRVIEILRHPVHTSVAIDTRDFDYLNVEQNLHAAVSAKDFKAIVIHAFNSRVPVLCEYSKPSKPMRLSYDVDDGTVLCEFTLITRDAGGDAGVQSASRPGDGGAAPEDLEESRIEIEHLRSVRVTPQERFLCRRRDGFRSQSPGSAPSRNISQQATSVPQPPITPAPSLSVMPPPFPGDQINQPTQTGPTPSLLEDESLFVPANNDDHQWDGPVYEDEDEDVLRWDANVPRIHQDAIDRTKGNDDDDDFSSMNIPPTQHISQVIDIGSIVFAALPNILGNDVITIRAKPSYADD
ncbi:hypothetical protein KEM54_006441 [Ascosphaera aggregata]|nr:hypothetical protein KEM54_006441 [Ascosphaera aggregata]